MRTTPYWWGDDFPVRVSEAALPKQVDVAVSGCGYTGLSAALVLLQAGRSVALLERGRAGEGASSRNAGMCGDQLKPSFADLADRYGEVLATRLYGEARDALSFFQESIVRHGIDCDFQKTGRLTGATSEAQIAGLAREAETLRSRIGIPYEMLTRSDLAQEVGTDAYVGGRLLPHHGGVHPAKYVAGLVGCVAAAGGTIHETTPLVAYERRPGGFLLRTPRGTLTARDLVVATNGYTGRATRALRRRIIPVTSYMIATDELPGELMARLMPKRRLMTDTNRLLCYYRPSPDGRRILFGGRPAYTEISPEKSARRLRAYLDSLFPDLTDAPVTHSWFGMIGYTFDHLPHVGEIDGAHYTGGYCGSGVVMSTWLGNKVAARMLGRAEGATAFAEIPHPTHMLYHGRPWFLPIVQAWYQLADIWDRR